VGAEVARRSTPSDAQTVLNALARAWLARFGEPLRGDVAALLLALSDLETGTWKHVRNNNLGNQIAVGSDDFILAPGVGPTGEQTGRFAAYPSLDDGARAFVALLTRDSRAEWRAGLLSGNPETFVRALNGQMGGPAYFEASFERYFRGFLSRYASYEQLAAAPRPRSERKNSNSPESGSGAIVAIAAPAVLLGAWIAWRLAK